MMIQMIYNNS